MSEPLYNTRILRLAAAIPHMRRLEGPQATVRKVSPICGSRVTVDLDMKDGKVSRFGQDVRACALGQASAAILGDRVLGLTAAELAAARDALRIYLQEDGDLPPDWPELEIFAPARAHRARHASMLLAFEAAAEASAGASAEA